MNAAAGTVSFPASTAAAGDGGNRAVAATPTLDGSGSGAARAGRRALIVFPGALGDFLMLAPALAGLAAAGARVELSVRRALAELAQAMFPGGCGPPADGAAMASLFAGELDDAVAAWLRGADTLDVWFEGAGLVERHAQALGLARVRRHRVERGDAGEHASLVYAAALAVGPIPARVPEGWLAGVAVPHRPRGLVLHPGAGALHKRWDSSGFLRIADAWRARGGEAILLLGPAEEHERPVWAATGYEVASGLTLRESAALLASAPCYVGNDSGISHLAAVLGRRGVVLFSATNPERWRPFGDVLAPIRCGGADAEAVCARVLTCLDRVAMSP